MTNPEREPPGPQMSATSSPSGSLYMFGAIVLRTLGVQVRWNLDLHYAQNNGLYTLCFGIKVQVDSPTVHGLAG